MRITRTVPSHLANYYVCWLTDHALSGQKGPLSAIDVLAYGFSSVDVDAQITVVEVHEGDGAPMCTLAPSCPAVLVSFGMSLRILVRANGREC
jgi:hypothetical protein